MKPSEVFAYLVDVGVDILCTTLDAATGVLSAQTGDSTTQKPDADRAEWWQTVGFVSRPAVPTPGNSACQAIVLKRSDRDIIISTRDVRGTGIQGNLADGEACVYAPGSQARTLYKADGSVTSITTDSNATSGNSVFLRVDPTGVSAYSPNVGFKGDAMGWRFSTWHGARFTMSGLGLPAPFASLGLNSLISLSADVITLDAAVLNLGRVGGTGIAQAVVQAVPLAADMALVATALSDINSAIAGITVLLATFTGTGTFPGAAAPPWTTLIAAVSSAVGAANTALAKIATPFASGGTASNTTIA